VGCGVGVAVTVMCECVFKMFQPGLCEDTTYYSTEVFVCFVSGNLKYHKENNSYNESQRDALFLKFI